MYNNHVYFWNMVQYPQTNQSIPLFRHDASVFGQDPGLRRYVYAPMPRYRWWSLSKGAAFWCLDGLDNGGFVAVIVAVIGGFVKFLSFHRDFI